MEAESLQLLQILADPGAVGLVGYLLSRHLDKLADRVVDRWIERTDRDEALARRDRKDILHRLAKIEAKVGA